MTPVSLGLDSLLALLLIAALAVGVRLNAKLKVLRESHVGFAKAVADLDLAAGRAEAGLAALRAATIEAHDALLTRIETARSLAARLDRACEDGAAVAERAEASAARAQAAALRAERAATLVPAAVPTPTSASPARPRLVEPAGGANDAPDTAAVLRLIETAREEAGAFPTAAHARGDAVEFGALRPPPVQAAPAAPAEDADASADRLARFVARRREARAR